MSYVFTPDVPSSDVEKRGFPIEGTAVWFLGRNCNSCGSDTVFPSFKQNVTQLRCHFKSAITSSRIAPDKQPVEKQPRWCMATQKITIPRSESCISTSLGPGIELWNITDAPSSAFQFSWAIPH
jgi:hypothetical protein